MKGPARALYRILVCTALLVSGVRSGDDSHIQAIDSDSIEPISSIQNEDMNLAIEYLDSPLCNYMSFFSTQTEDIEYYACLPSTSTILHNPNMDQSRTYTELVPRTKQTGTLPSFYSTFYESGTECPPVYCIPNEPVQKHTESESLRNDEQSSNKKRHKKAIEENIPRKKQKKTNESSIDLDSTDNDELNSSKFKQIKKNISIWNNARLKNKHRECLHLGYRPAVAFNKIGHKKYKKIGDEMHQLLIETHIKRCKAVYNITPVQNEFWFVIASRSACMHIKHEDCKAMNANSSDYKFIEGLGGYYPGLPGDIVRYMDKHRPIVSKQESIKTEWTETLGDIYVRIPIEPEYGINEEIITFKGRNEYKIVGTAVQMILALPDVHKDLSNITVKFIDKTLKEETDSNHLAVVRALHEIVAKYKSTNHPELDEQYAVLCGVVFTNILQKACVSYESIVIHLYAEMYKSITYFYEKAEICEEILDIEKRKRKGGKDKEYYLLAGKCLIKPQRYLKCVTTVYSNQLVSMNKHEITEETDKWSIPSDINKHYHIHYVDNTKQQYTRVCIPMHLDQHIHTIAQTIEYLKRLYNIEMKECICPYTRNQFGYWKYIEEEERDKTVNCFIYCNIVFYYIEEGLRKNYFTFAEFESYVQPKGETVRIPLFLSPLMQSAVSMGPFEEADKEEHTLVDSMQFMCEQPSVYIYKKEYKTKEYSHMHHYYTNLYIRRDNADMPTIDCYIMNSKATTSNGITTVEWYAKVSNSVDEYTHCILSDELINDQEKYNKFGKAVMSREYTPDSVLYGFSLQNNLEKTSELDGIGCSTDDSIGKNVFFDFKLGIALVHKISANTKIADIQYKLDQLDKDIKQINMNIKEPGIAEELKKERKKIYRIKYISKRKLEKIQPEDQLFIEEEFSATPLPLCFFLVFQHRTTQTKSSLGAHNEIFDALTYRYNTH